MKFGIVVDSTFYLSEDQFKKNNIKRASLNIIDRDETFKEMDVDVNFVYSRLNKGHKLTTSQPSPVEFNDIYEEYIKQGVEKIFVLTLAPPLSGTFQSATLAKTMLDKPEIVHVFESKMAAFGNEMITLELIEMIEANKETDEIIKRIDHLIEKSHLIFTVEGLENLRRSGRLSRAKAIIGTVLRVKPLIQMVDGKLDLFKSARTHKKVFDAILENISETTKNAKTLYVRVLSHNSLDTARELEKAIKEKFSNIKITFNEYLGPVFSLHLGANGYGVSWTTE